MSNKNIYAVISVKMLNSQQHGGLIYCIELLDATGQFSHTYVDPTNKNYKNWQHIIQHPDHGFAIENVHYKNKSKNLVDADSKITIFHETEDKDFILSMFADFIAGLPSLHRRAFVNELFDIE